MFVHLSVCLLCGNNQVPIGVIFTKFDICAFFENLFRKLSFTKILQKQWVLQLHEVVWTLIIISR